MAKEKNFTLRIDAHLLDQFLAACRAKDQTASAVLRDQMRHYVRSWRKRVNSPYTDDADDDLTPGHDDRDQRATLRADAAEAKRKRLADEKRAADLKAAMAQRVSELKAGANKAPTQPS